MKAPNIALVNGQWFNGHGFEQRTFFSVNGNFVSAKPSRIDSTIDLKGTYIVPPFGDAHNHNIGTGVEELDKKAIQNFLNNGVFYVKIQGNLPLNADMKKRLLLNQYNSVDVMLAQGSLTATGGQPIFLVEKILLPQGYFPGYTNETLKDYRYFTIDSETELKTKWPLILKLKPDFIKTFLWGSGEYLKYKDDSSVLYKGLDPELLPKIVLKAHSQKLKVSTHVTNADDFHNAVAAGVDEITHLPRYISGTANNLITAKDAQLAARRKIVVITTVAVSLFQGGVVKKADFPQARNLQIANLKLLFENGVPIAIGSDNPGDNSVKEVFYLKELGIFDNLALLKMWTETTAHTIFPKRKIGALRNGYEASFIALEGNPVEDLDNIKKIKYLFKQGYLLSPDINKK
ncbi:MAG: amidohydrolase family protein [Ferruginibacter sp.]